MGSLGGFWEKIVKAGKKKAWILGNLGRVWVRSLAFGIQTWVGEGPQSGLGSDGTE